MAAANPFEILPTLFSLKVCDALISVVEGYVFFSKASSPFTESSRLPIQWESAELFLFPVVKQPAREADRSPSPGAVFEKDSYTSAPPFVYTACPWTNLLYAFYDPRFSHFSKYAIKVPTYANEYTEISLYSFI
jgi:hypothetical protein